MLEQAVTQKLDAVGIHAGLWSVASLQHDSASADKEFQWLIQHDPARAFGAQSQMAAYAGKLRNMRTFGTKATDANTRSGLSETAALRLINTAVFEANCGDRDNTRTDVATAITLAPTSRDVARQAAVALAIGGFAKDAQLLLDQTLRDFPETDTLAKAVYVPNIRAALDLAKGSAAAAVDVLQAAAPYDSQDNVTMYLRAAAYLAADRSADAAAEFRKIIDRARSAPFNRYTPLAQLGLGRAFARQGDLDKSRTAYQDFFASWKDADPDIPILIAAKKEYAALK